MAAEASKQEQGLEKVEPEHADQQQEQAQFQGKPGQSQDPSKALDQALALLKSRNDTNRFVGLALLRSILDNKIDFQKDPETVNRCWAAVPATFLDGLLRAPLVKKRSKEESQHMVELAVAVLHAFIVLLPDYIKNDTKCLGRLGGIASALAWSPPDTKTQIFHIMLTLASTEQGSAALMSTDAWPQLIRSASQHQLALDVIKYAYLNMSLSRVEGLDIGKALNGTIGDLVNAFEKSSDCSVFFQTLQEVFNSLQIDASPYLEVSPDFQPLNEEQLLLPQSPPWLGSLAGLIRQSCVGRPRPTAAKTRKSALLLTASLLHLFPSSFPSVLFNEAPKSRIAQDSKPLTHLFIKLLLIEIRSTVPYLQERANSNDVPTSDGLAASYDIITAFIGFLIQLLDKEDSASESDDGTNHSSTSIFPPSFLLQLRADISEAMSITIEHLRDRLENFASQFSPLKLIAPSPAENPSAKITQDPLTLSQLRTLALWLREDDNYALRKEAASITDTFLALYALEDPALEFRSPVLIALEGTLAVPEGIEAFLAIDGWAILVQDLRAILAPPSPDARAVARGIEIVRVLLSIVESDVVGPAKEPWMDLINLITPSSPNPKSNSKNKTASAPEPPPPLHWDLRIALAQLAVELLTRAPRNVRRRWMGAAAPVLAMARALVGRGDVQPGVREGAREVVQGMEALGGRAGGVNW